jgi:predicted ATPase
MKILSLEIDGFRSLKHISGWQPGELALLIGPNGSGKSNILRALELLAVSAQGELGELIRSAGGIGPLVWDGAAEAVRFKVAFAPTDRAGDDTLRELTYELHLSPFGKSGEYRIANERLANYRNPDQNKSPQPLEFLDRHLSRARVLDRNQHMLSAQEEYVPPLETVLSLAADPFAQNQVLASVRAQMSAWSVYHDFRTEPDAPIRLPQVTRHEKRVQPDGQNLISVLHTLYTNDRDFEKEINAAMQAAFGADFDKLLFPPAADQRIQLRLRWKSLRREQSAADLSDGTLRFLFLLTVLSSPDPAPLIAIDEPETGLHPSMLPIVAEYARDAAQRTQVILTSHSPPFLDAFGKTPPTTTIVKWNDGQTELKTIAGDELHRWLEEYSLGALHKSGELEAMAS